MTRWLVSVPWHLDTVQVFIISNNVAKCSQCAGCCKPLEQVQIHVQVLFSLLRQAWLSATTPCASTLLHLFKRSHLHPLCLCLSRGWGFCLDDRPSKRDLTTPLARLGVRYTTHHQCQLQYGPNATFCHEVDVSAALTDIRDLFDKTLPPLTVFLTSSSQNVCQILWCSVNGSCRSKLDSPIDGTRCGPEKVGGASCFVPPGFGFH